MHQFQRKHVDFLVFSAPPINCFLRELAQMRSNTLRKQSLCSKKLQKSSKGLLMKLLNNHFVIKFFYATCSYRNERKSFDNNIYKLKMTAFISFWADDGSRFCATPYTVGLQSDFFSQLCLPDTDQTLFRSQWRRSRRSGLHCRTYGKLGCSQTR